MRQFITTMLLLFSLALSAKSISFNSPNKQVTVTLNTDKELTWSITSGQTVVITPSALSLNVTLGNKQQTLGSNLNCQKSKPVTHLSKNNDEESYTECVVAGKDYKVEFRAYNNGAACYRFVIGKKGSNVVHSEQADFHFADNYTCYAPYVNDNRGGEHWSHSFEAYYDIQKLQDLYKDSVFMTPAAISLPQQKKAVILEAGLENYPGMYLLHKQGNSVEAAFPTLPLETKVGGFNRLNLMPTKRSADIAKDVTTLPWRIVLTVDRDIDLIGNKICEWLSPASRIADTSWIKPGKAAWEWWNNWNISGVNFRAGINTETYKYYTDFAAANHLEYLVIDEGWSDSEDLLTLSNPKTLDLNEIVSYAKGKNVGIILWSSWRNLTQRGTAKMDEIMSHYQQMGVKGFKVDFFDRDDQVAIQSAYEVAQCAAKHHLLLDLHGLKPFGIQFAYPNILNFEGVKGLENSKWEPLVNGKPLHDQPAYDCLIPFLRNLVGPMDYTPGTMNNAVQSQFYGNNDHPMSQGTRVHQMAMYTVFYAPLQMLADSPTKYMKEQECTSFLAQIPTTWDETLPLAGEMGKYVAVARRKGNVWYVGVLGNWDEHKSIDLNLDKMNVEGWNVEAFADGPNADREATDYTHSKTHISGNHLTINLAPGGGWTAIIKK